jgi:hypothetical protein
MTKVMLILTLAATAAAFTPRAVEAQECTGGYLTCLNDTWDTKGIIRVLADVECFSKYLRCVRGS